jgi:hypothetical protein
VSRSRSSRNRSRSRQSGNNSSQDSAANNDYDDNARESRFTTETKEATKTTELITFIVAVIGIAVTAFTVDNDPDFGAERAWLYITILAVGYMISRGLAKAGSHEPYDDYDIDADHMSPVRMRPLGGGLGQV